MSSLRQFLINKNFHRIKFSISKSNHLIINAEINSKEGVFLLDTGASATCVGRDYAEEFQLLSEKGEAEIAGSGPTRMTMELSSKNKIKIGDWEKSKNDLILFDMNHINRALEEGETAQAHGIIGADILKSGKAVIDYKQKCLYLK